MLRASLRVLAVVLSILVLGVCSNAARQTIGTVTMLVHEYDEAIEFYTTKLGFDLVSDMGEGNDRFVQVAPSGGQSAVLLLARANTMHEQAFVGNQTGGRVFMFLHTDDFWRDHTAMTREGVAFLEEPRDEPYGIVAVFEDLYGNTWDLIQHK